MQMDFSEGEERVITFQVNGKVASFDDDPSTPLLWVLRDNLQLTGTKYGCGIARCGACTVHIDGEQVRSCVTPVSRASGRSVTTIEGLANGGQLHPMQRAFLDNDALQCGYCTPGQIMSAVACVNEGHANSVDEIREYMSGNLCRCAAYRGIQTAITEAAPKMRKP